jgi:hypothetical protein
MKADEYTTLGGSKRLLATWNGVPVDVKCESDQRVVAQHGDQVHGSSLTPAVHDVMPRRVRDPAGVQQFDRKLVDRISVSI